MRNTQPLLTTAPFRERVEWTGPSLQAPSNDRSLSPILERLQSMMRALADRSRTGWKLGLRGGLTTPLPNTPITQAGSIPYGSDVTRSTQVGRFDALPSRCPRWKRTLDLALVILTLPVWLAVMILVTFWIKLVSPGPTFYKQERVGYRGRRFMILKFRSMQVNVETQSHEQHFETLIKANTPMAKLDAVGDPRLIRGGRLLRALGFDELPQLLNVLRNEMSLVGPRPCTPKEFEHYQVWQRERVNAPPGLTGFWQVNGKNRTTFTEMVAMDIFYSEHMSLFLDLEILLKTTSAVAAQAVETHLKRHSRP